MNCPTCHTPARHVAGQIHYCSGCNRNHLDRSEPAQNTCQRCASWYPTHNQRGLCLHAKSRRDETAHDDTCELWGAA